MVPDTLRAFVRRRTSAMLYEMRVYEAVPGKMGALNRRFANHTHQLFVKHGFHVVGYWNEAIGDSDKLTYMLGWTDLNERFEKFAAFGADPDWQKAREESERDGPLVANIRNSIWRPTAYSPMQ
jgi:hypothetical protein